MCLQACVLFNIGALYSQLAAKVVSDQSGLSGTALLFFVAKGS
jgi:hypothetical protein